MTVHCAYCLAPFRHVSCWDDRQTCGNPLCKARTAVWNGWITRTIRVTPGQPLPIGSSLPPLSDKHRALIDQEVTHQYTLV